MPENIKLVDLSTAMIAGNQPADNVLRLKPVVNDSVRLRNYDRLGTVTIIGERHIGQFDIVYTNETELTSTVITVDYSMLRDYSNPEISMPQGDMSKFAWAVYGLKPRFNNIRKSAYGINARVNNIYSVGNYFFIDFSLQNKTNIAYDIDEMRVKLTDKRQAKATSSQTIELKPVFTLMTTASFRKDYRNVIVLDRLTFPDEKVLRLEITENQISGRVISLDIEYNDILNADGFGPEVEKRIVQGYYF